MTMTLDIPVGRREPSRIRRESADRHCPPGDADRALMRPLQSGHSGKGSTLPTTQWFLTSSERGNPSTRLDSRHHGDVAWTEGNLVRPLVHGVAYFAELHRRVSRM